MLVENLSKGFDLYDLPRLSPSYTFAIPANKRCVKAGVFAEDSSIVVCGSDHGKIYVFSMASPVPLQIMGQASRWTAIQTLDVSSTIIRISQDLPRPGRDYYGRAFHRKWKFSGVIGNHYLGKKGDDFVRKLDTMAYGTQIKKANISVEESQTFNRIGNLVNLLILLLLMTWTWNLWTPFVFQVCPAFLCMNMK